MVVGGFHIRSSSDHFVALYPLNSQKLITLDLYINLFYRIEGITTLPCYHCCDLYAKENYEDATVFLCGSDNSNCILSKYRSDESSAKGKSPIYSVKHETRGLDNTYQLLES